MGLATVYGIVKQNDGSIEVHSKPGDGTRFDIYLPRHVGEAEQLSPVEAHETPQGEGEIVLLVEDEPGIREMCQVILKKLGYRVLAADTPEDALHIADNHRGGIDLLVTDVVMPGMHGRELTDNLQVRFPDIKTLYMSGYTADVIADRGVLEKEVHFIQKPFSVKDLGLKVRETLKTP